MSKSTRIIHPIIGSAATYPTSRISVKAHRHSSWQSWKKSTVIPCGRTLKQQDPGLPCRGEEESRHPGNDSEDPSISLRVKRADAVGSRSEIEQGRLCNAPAVSSMDGCMACTNV
jgi:hypothetical protein